MAALWIRYSVGGGPVRINIDGMSDVMDLVQYLCTTQPKLKGVDASDVTVHSPDDSHQYDLDVKLSALGQTTLKNPHIVKFALPQQYGPLSTGMSSNDALHASTGSKKRRLNDEPDLKPFDMTKLLKPSEVQPPAIESDAPPFTARPDWLVDAVAEIRTNFLASDGSSRVEPMALVRCSRGGKTRALKEIGRMLKDTTLKDACIIFVSFNDYSSLEPWEQDDPVAALCRRIAFAAMPGGDGNNTFTASVDVRPQQILDWLGDHHCVLLIDELNLLEVLECKEGVSPSVVTVAAAKEFARFLKVNFLIFKNRYFVFSSHVLSAVSDLSAYMDSRSSRGVSLLELPLIPSLKVAVTNFDWPNLNARQAINYGLIPAVIHEAHRSDALTTKRKNAIKLCIKDITDTSIKLLMASFITGEPYIPEPLLQLMDSSRDLGEFKIKWIPYHMIAALNRFSHPDCTVSTEIRYMLKHIVALFNDFQSAKESSGDGWEVLFVVTLIVRCLAGLFDVDIFDLRAFGFTGLGNSAYTVSYNEPFAGVMVTLEDVDKFLGLIPNGQKSHIGIYYPPHARFQRYDVIIVVWDNMGHRSRIIGYQLKEGAALPKLGPNKKFTSSYVIRGDSGAESKKNGWLVATDEQIDKFMGVSGKQWTPKQWKALLSVD